MKTTHKLSKLPENVARDSLLINLRKLLIIYIYGEQKNLERFLGELTKFNKSSKYSGSLSLMYILSKRLKKKRSFLMILRKRMNFGGLREQNLTGFKHEIKIPDTFTKKLLREIREILSRVFRMLMGDVGVTSIILTVFL